MQRLVISLIAGFAVVALILTGIIGGAKFAQPATVSAQGATPTATSQAQPAHPLPAQLQFLSSLTPEERFDHFTGGQLNWVNPQGQAVTLSIIAGKVTAVTSNTVTVQPNGTTTTRTFNVTANTMVRGKAHPGSLVAFAPGDRVLVTSVGNSNDATSITARSFAGAGAAGHAPGHGMMPASGQSTPAPATPTATPTS
ncbi:MAG TPA: hypothetical protein VFZ25_18280 [Chloroflexota bacterium]|nr:hypothetical protein [Chloroflexota bacterium]